MSMLGEFFEEDGMDELVHPLSDRRIAGVSSYRLPDRLVGRGSQQFVGLQNQGTTCYLNSLLQVLFMSPELREGLYQVTPAELGIDPSLSTAACPSTTYPTPFVDSKPGTVNLGTKSPSADFVAQLGSPTSQLNPLPQAPASSPVGSPTQKEIQLLDLGFSIDKVRRALRVKKNNVEEAGNWLIEHVSEEDGGGELDEELGASEEGYNGLPALVTVEENVASAPEVLAMMPNVDHAYEWHGDDGGWANGGDSERLSSIVEERDKNDRVTPIGSELPAAVIRPRRKVRRGLMELQKLFAFMQGLDRPAVSTQDLTRSFKWDDRAIGVQHDVHELNRILFDAIEDSLKGTAQERLIEQLYKGISVNQVKCLVCGFVSEREEEYSDISVVVKGFSNLEDSFEAATRVEKLSGDNQYSCDTCGHKVDAERSQRWRTMPHLLTLPLCRFDFDWNKNERYKISTELAFPQLLNVAPYMATPKATQGSGPKEGADPMSQVLYELVAVVIHSGSAHSGHYHAYIKDVFLYSEERGKAVGGTGGSGGEGSSRSCFEGPGGSERWFDFNDSVVKVIHSDAISRQFGGSVGECAYMLTYRSRSPARLSNSPTNPTGHLSASPVSGLPFLGQRNDVAPSSSSPQGELPPSPKNLPSATQPVDTHTAQNRIENPPPSSEAVELHEPPGAALALEGGKSGKSGDDDGEQHMSVEGGVGGGTVAQQGRAAATTEGEVNLPRTMLAMPLPPHLLSLVEEANTELAREREKAMQEMEEQAARMAREWEEADAAKISVRLYITGEVVIVGDHMMAQESLKLRLDHQWSTLRQLVHRVFSPAGCLQFGKGAYWLAILAPAPESEWPPEFQPLNQQASWREFLRAEVGTKGIDTEADIGADVHMHLSETVEPASSEPRVGNGGAERDKEGRLEEVKGGDEDMMGGGSPMDISPEKEGGGQGGAGGREEGGGSAKEAGVDVRSAPTEQEAGGGCNEGQPEGMAVDGQQSTGALETGDEPQANRATVEPGEPPNLPTANPPTPFFCYKLLNVIPLDSDHQFLLGTSLRDAGVVDGGGVLFWFDTESKPEVPEAMKRILEARGAKVMRRAAQEAVGREEDGRTIQFDILPPAMEEGAVTRDGEGLTVREGWEEVKDAHVFVCLNLSLPRVSEEKLSACQLRIPVDMHTTTFEDVKRLAVEQAVREENLTLPPPDAVQLRLYKAGVNNSERFEDEVLVSHYVLAGQVLVMEDAEPFEVTWYFRDKHGQKHDMASLVRLDQPLVEAMAEALNEHPMAPKTRPCGVYVKVGQKWKWDCEGPPLITTRTMKENKITTGPAIDTCYRPSDTTQVENPPPNPLNLPTSTDFFNGEDDEDTAVPRAMSLSLGIDIQQTQPHTKGFGDLESVPNQPGTPEGEGKGGSSSSSNGESGKSVLPVRPVPGLGPQFLEEVWDVMVHEGTKVGEVKQQILGLPAFSGADPHRLRLREVIRKGVLGREVSGDERSLREAEFTFGRGIAARVLPREPVPDIRKLLTWPPGTPPMPVSEPEETPSHAPSFPADNSEMKIQEGKAATCSQSEKESKGGGVGSEGGVRGDVPTLSQQLLLVVQRRVPVPLGTFDLQTDGDPEGKEADLEALGECSNEGTPPFHPPSLADSPPIAAETVVPGAKTEQAEAAGGGGGGGGVGFGFTSPQEVHYTLRKGQCGELHFLTFLADLFSIPVKRLRVERYVSRTNRLKVLHSTTAVHHQLHPRGPAVGPSGAEVGPREVVFDPPPAAGCGEAGGEAGGGGEEGGTNGFSEVGGEELQGMTEGGAHEKEGGREGRVMKPEEYADFLQTLPKEERRTLPPPERVFDENLSVRGDQHPVMMDENMVRKFCTYKSATESCAGARAKKSRVQGPEYAEGEPFDLKNGDVVVVSDSNDGLADVTDLRGARFKAEKSPVGADTIGFSEPSERIAPLLLQGPPGRSKVGSRPEVALKISMDEYED